MSFYTPWKGLEMDLERYEELTARRLQRKARRQARRARRDKLWLAWSAELRQLKSLWLESYRDIIGYRK
ncbi:hypothetical protein H7X69_01035 [Candidatus Saccharibacteria bacterium]|nr:hypothetical protein [Candidatus Saccharibacteria bacterium]